jgi:hypothetical protein
MAEAVSELIRPPFFSCANAVGACVANVVGELGKNCTCYCTQSAVCLKRDADTIEILQDRDLDEVLEQCKTKAIARAVHAGAKPDTVKVVEIETLPIQVC